MAVETITWKTVTGAWSIVNHAPFTSPCAALNSNTSIVISNENAFSLSHFRAEVNFVCTHNYWSSCGFVLSYNDGVDGLSPTYLKVYQTLRRAFVVKYKADSSIETMIDYSNGTYLPVNTISKMTLEFNLDAPNRLRLILNDTTPLLTVDDVDISDIAFPGSVGLATASRAYIYYDNFQVSIP